MNKKILITGGDGFIARSLKENYHDKYSVTCLGRKDLDLLNSDYVLNFLRNNKFDVVIHTATYDAVPRFSTKDAKLVLENNLKMFLNIARSSDHYDKMIYYGSGAVFGRENWTPKMKEVDYDNHLPADQYGLSKYIMNAYSLNNEKIHNLRLFGVFGEYDDWRYRFISTSCCKAIFDLPITFRKNVFFDFLYIKDLVRITEWFINNQSSYRTYNVCSGKTIDYLTLANKINKLSGKNLPIRAMQPGLGVEYSGNNDRLVKELKGFGFTPIDDALVSMLEWTKNNKSIIKAELFEY